MRITTEAGGKLIAAALGFLLAATPAHAEIMAVLELPSGFASGVSNVQGWAYTTTPGAELIQPFAVLIDGVEQFKVPCCGDRGDVKDAHPDAPLLTGFSAVYNWGLAAPMAPVKATAGTPQGILAPQITVQVVITDTMGGLEILTQKVFLFHPTTWPFSKLVTWKLPEMATSADAAQGILIPPDATCTLFNSAIFTDGAAELRCTNLVFTAPDDTTKTCSSAYLSWDKGSQSFRLTSPCSIF